MAVPTRSHAVRIPPSRSEQKVPSLETFVNNAPPSLRKLLPPVSSVNTAKALRRTSSVYSRATRCWDEPPLWPEDEPLPPIPALPFLAEKRSCPELTSPDVSPLTPELQETLPPLLEPRTYQPVLPTPSPSLAPASMRKRSSNVTTLSALLPRKESDQSWGGHSRDGAQLSPSPPPMSPYVDEKFSLFRNESQASDDPSPPGSHQRSKSDNLTPTATLSAPFDRPATDTHYRNNSIDRALSHMRFGIDVSMSLQRSPPTRHEDDEDTDDPSQDPEDVLSSTYRDSLINEYKDLAAPPAGHWRDDGTNSDADTSGHELKMVPAPLFWENRQKELYPQRAAYAQQKQSGQRHDTKLRELAAGPEPPSPRKHRKKISLSDAPLQMILPSQYKRKSINSEPDDSPTTAALKKALALRLYSKKSTVNRHSTEDEPRLFHGKPISKPIQDGPMPLQLPKIAYRDVEVKKAVVRPATTRHAKESHARRSGNEAASYGRNTPDSADDELEYTVPSNKDISRVDPSEMHSKSYRHPETRCSNDHRSDRDSGKLLSFLTVPPTPGLGSLFHRRSGSAETSEKTSFKKGHTRDKSSGNGTSADNKLQSTFSPVDEDRKSMRPAIFDKALDAIRERERAKKRKNLKSQIKFVGQVDPAQVQQQPAERQRRETFGEGWI